MSFGGWQIEMAKLAQIGAIVELLDGIEGHHFSNEKRTKYAYNLEYH